MGDLYVNIPFFVIVGGSSAFNACGQGRKKKENRRRS